MKLILLIVVSALAFLGGAFGGDLLHGSRPASHAQDDDEGGHGAPGTELPSEPSTDHAAKDPAEHGETAAADDWFRFPNQFFVPLLRHGSVEGVMILTLAVEMPADLRPQIEAQELRLRDSLLSTLMIEANTGAFDGNFTSEPSMSRLREALLKAARVSSGPRISKVLIADIARQEQ